MSPSGTFFIPKMGIMKPMDTKKQIEKDLKDALRAGDEVRKRTLRMVLSSIKLAEVDKGEALEEEEVLAILRKELKSRRESIADAEQAGRLDIVTESEAEISVLEEYLPQPLTQDEILKLANQAVAEVGASSPQEMGNVMKVLMPRVKGRADGSLVSQTVRNLLTDK
jgi:uncharacterized protein YqeY